MTITHGIFMVYGTFDNLIHEMDKITANEPKQENKIVNWKETKVTDNSNSARYQKMSIYRERWR